MVPPAVAWQRLFLLQEVLLERPDLARAVRRLPLSDQLLLTLEVLDETDQLQAPSMPSNVVPFRTRVPLE